MHKDKTVEMLIEKIERRLDDKLMMTVSDVAKFSGYSIRYVQKIFKEITGLKISDYIKKED
ncbi:AraC family transcriptional regulator [Escherichia coli]|nr:AraC family transcriptional regulator [Escherichia coli]HDP4976722.1 helix-turn-helix transcriptional regulator [Escherichia coli]